MIYENGENSNKVNYSAATLSLMIKGGLLDEKICLIIVGLVTFILVDKVMNNKSNDVNEKTSNESEATIDNVSIRGLYEYHYEFDDFNLIDYYIYLYDDGYYRYTHTALPVDDSEIGTYSISNNSIILNQLYAIKGDMYNESNKKITLEINSDGTISDKNGYYSYYDYINAGLNIDEKYKNFDFDNIIMTKASKTADEEYLNSYSSPTSEKPNYNSENNKEGTITQKESSTSSSNNDEIESLIPLTSSNVKNSDFIKEWSNEKNMTNLAIYEDGTFLTDHWTASSEIRGTYEINGTNIYFTNNDGTSWSGELMGDQPGNFVLKINQNEKYLVLYDYTAYED